MSNRVQDGGKPAIEPNKQKPIGIVQVRSPRCPPAKHIDLLPQDQDFCLQLCSRLQERSHDAKNQFEQFGHQGASLPRPFSASTSNRIFGTHRVSRKIDLTDFLNLRDGDYCIGVISSSLRVKGRCECLRCGDCAISNHQKTSEAY